MVTETLTPNETGIACAAALLARGDTVAFPTETVYGLGANAGDGKAVARIYEAKGRPSFNPLIVHVADIAAARALTQWSDAAETLAQAFWPGPMTLVLPRADGSALSELVTAGLPSVAIRVPAHPLATALLKSSGLPLAAPSANPSGRITATTAQHVIDGLDGRIAAVLDGGACEVGLESTIIGLTDTPRLLRPGGLPQAFVEQALGQTLAPALAGISAPGQLTSHYAPAAQMRLNVTDPEINDVHLGFGGISGDINLSPSGDLREAAARLFACLHQLDKLNKPIAVAPVPLTGLGLAINDRLARAAAPRDS